MIFYGMGMGSPGPLETIALMLAHSLSSFGTSNPTLFIRTLKMPYVAYTSKLVMSEFVCLYDL